MNALAWDDVLEQALLNAEAALTSDNFETAHDVLEALDLASPQSAALITGERVRALRLLYARVGDKIGTAQDRLAAAMGKTGSTRRAVRAYAPRSRYPG